MDFFIYANYDKKQQDELIIEATSKGFLAYAIPFMVSQKPEEFGRPTPDTSDCYNGSRPYLTLSNLNPDNTATYYNWTYLQSALESGWESQFK